MSDTWLHMDMVGNDQGDFSGDVHRLAAWANIADGGSAFVEVLETSNNHSAWTEITA